jgi:hypothetical protein
MADLTLDLFRACKRNRRTMTTIGDQFRDSSGAGALYPDYIGFRRRDGSVRAPDVTTFTDSEGVVWVRGVDDVNPATRRRYVSAIEGVSLNTEAGRFGYDTWFYFVLPTGTSIPESLDVTQTGADENHYSIRCRNSMKKEAYEGALDTLARAAIAKAVELARQSLLFS